MTYFNPLDKPTAKEIQTKDDETLATWDKRKG